MKNKYWKYGIWLFILTYIFMGCSSTIPMKENNIQKLELQIEDTSNEPVIEVYASIYPLYDFAKKVGGDLIEVEVIVPSGTDPHSFEPSPKVLAKLQQADVFIYNGLGIEPWIEGVLDLLKDKNVVIIEASEGLDLIEYNVKEDHAEEDEHKDHNHDHEDYDPHIWMDPFNAQKIAEKIKEAFVELNPDNIGTYEGNFISFQKQLEKLDEDFKEGLKDAVGKKIIVSHSAFGYLAHRYDIGEISVSGISPHEEPSPARLAELTKKAKEHNIQHIFFEVLANPKTAELLAEEGNLEILTLYNIEGLTEEQRQMGEEYISLMYKNLENLRKALVE